MALSNFRQGSIELSVSRPHFMCRENVAGWVTLTLQEDFPAGELLVELIGLEKECTFELAKIDRLEAKDKKWETRKNVFMYARKIIRSEEPGWFGRGTHQFEFELKMGAVDKPTFHHSCRSLKHLIRADCQYTIRVTLKDSRHILKTKKEVVVYSNDRPTPGKCRAKARFDLKGLQGMFRTKSTSLEIDCLQPYLDMETENSVLLNIDTSNSHASPLNVTLSLINVVIIRREEGLFSCHNLVWSGLLTGKLTKGTDYSGNVGFIMKIPRQSLEKYYQTFCSPHVINQFCLRLSYQASASEVDQNCVLLPIQFYRSALPAHVVTAACPGSHNLSSIQLKEVGGLFIDPKTQSFRKTWIPQSDQKEVDRDTKDSLTSHEKIFYRTNPTSQQHSFRPFTSDTGPAYSPMLRSKSHHVNEVPTHRRINVVKHLEVTKRISTK
jgi:hypothetical protein